VLSTNFTSPTARTVFTFTLSQCIRSHKWWYSSVGIRNQLDVTFVLSLISPLQVAQYVSGNHVPILRSWRLHSVIATCWCCAVVAGRLSEPVLRTPQWTHYLLTGSDTVVLRNPQWTHYQLTGSDTVVLRTPQWTHYQLTGSDTVMLRTPQWTHYLLTSSDTVMLRTPQWTH